MSEKTRASIRQTREAIRTPNRAAQGAGEGMEWVRDTLATLDAVGANVLWTLSTQRRSIMSEERGGSWLGFALGVILGGALGARLALRFAPEPGRQIRARLWDVAADVRDKTRAVSDELWDQAEAVLARSREVFDEKKPVLSTAVQAGKQASQRERARLSAD